MHSHPQDALRELILPVMQRVHDKVDFKLNYIGTCVYEYDIMPISVLCEHETKIRPLLPPPQNRPTADDGVKCKHGPSECMGNIIELCARELYPDPKINLGFIMCLTRDYQNIPNRALVEDCALEHAIDIKAINDCATKDDGAHGMELLRTSVERTAHVSLMQHLCVCVGQTGSGQTSLESETFFDVFFFLTDLSLGLHRPMLP